MLSIALKLPSPNSSQTSMVESAYLPLHAMPYFILFGIYLDFPLTIIHLDCRADKIPRFIFCARPRLFSLLLLFIDL